jgi:Na+(H+)/acetate symporter ActP
MSDFVTLEEVTQARGELASAVLYWLLGVLCQVTKIVAPVALLFVLALPFLQLGETWLSAALQGAIWGVVMVMAGTLTLVVLTGRPFLATYKDLRALERRIRSGEHVPRPNPSLHRTRSGGLRPPARSGEL